MDEKKGEKMGIESIDRKQFQPEASSFERIIDERGLVHYGGDTIADVELKAQWAREDAEKIWKSIMKDNPKYMNTAQEEGFQQAFDVTNGEIAETTKQTVQKIRNISGIKPEGTINDGSVPI